MTVLYDILPEFCALFKIYLYYLVKFLVVGIGLLR